MLTEVAYIDESTLVHEAGAALLRLMPNLRRPRTHLHARLQDPLAFRDAVLALGACARSELFVPAPEIERRAADPVITVAADAVYFEAFSLDESSYARVTVRKEALRDVLTLQPGTTNVDFTAQLAAGLERVRSNTRTNLVVDPDGLEVRVAGRRVREERIDLPDGWVHGFLAVQGAMRQPAVTISPRPVDLRNLLTYLRARKEVVSPRSLRFILEPGEAPVVVVEPWMERFVWEAATHDALAPREIRVWGRRRLLLLQHALAGARRVSLRLLGTGLPSFCDLDLGGASLTLGLSPWSERDWTADALPIGPPRLVPDALLDRTEELLRGAEVVDTAALVSALGLSRAEALELLDELCLRGRVLFDPRGDAPGAETFVLRRLFDGDPPAPPSPWHRQEAARGIAGRGGVTGIEDAPSSGGGRELRASVRGRGTYAVRALLDDGGRIRHGACHCPFFQRFGWQRGACKHILALHLAATGG
jgi:hypothetical protein